MNTKPKNTDVRFKQFRPEEIYIGLAQNHPEADKENDEGIVNVRNILYKPTGIEFLDTFMENLHRHGYKSQTFHANRLGVDKYEMSVGLHLLTGMQYRQFVEQYISFIVEDLYNLYPKHMRWIAKELGFASYSGFYRYGLRMGKSKWFQYGYNYEYEKAQEQMKPKPIVPHL